MESQPDNMARTASSNIKNHDDCLTEAMTPQSSLAVEAAERGPITITITAAENANSETRRNFTKLPAELRNRIYQYVLTSDQLFRYQPAHTALTDTSAHNQQLCLVHIGSSPFNPSTQESIHRVELVISTRLKTTATVLRPFNQLKHVNHLLLTETLSLELHHNTILFQDPWDLNPIHPTSISHLSSLTQHIQSSPRPWLTSVTLVAPDDLVYDLAIADPDTPTTSSSRFAAYTQHLTALAAFCKAHPTIEVNYAQTPFSDMQQFSGSPWTFVIAGMLLSIVFDPKGTLATRMLAHPAVRGNPFGQLAVEYAAVFEERGLFRGVVNLRMFPGNPQLMRERYGEGEITDADFEGGEKGVKGLMRKEEWVGWAMEWVWEGVRP